MCGLVFMVYLKVEEALSAEEEKRMLRESMMSMDEFACGLRVRLRKMLLVRCKLVREAKGRRKKRMWAKREAAAKEKGQKWVEKVGRKVEQFHVRPYVKEKLMQKVRRWKRNIEREK